MTNLLSTLPPFRTWSPCEAARPPLLLAPLIVLLVTAAADVEALTAQATTEVAGNSVEIGLGAGAGRFGGPGVALLFYGGGPAQGASLGMEFVGVFRRENYASGGAFCSTPAARAR